MKNRVMVIGLLVAGGMGFFAQPTYAAEYTGVTEKTYFQIKHLNSAFERDATYKIKSPIGGYVKNTTDARIAGQFNQTTIMRTQKGGELLFVIYADGGPSVWPTVEPGIYKNGNTYYYIANGLAQPISASDPQKAFVGVFNLPAFKAVKPVNSTQFRDLYGRGGTSTEIKRAKAMQQYLQGYAVMNVSDKGKMYFIPSDALESGANPIEIKASNFNALKAEAKTISTKKLHQIRKSSIFL